MPADVVPLGQSLHRNVLASHLSDVDPGVVARLNQMGQNFIVHGADAVAAKQRALAALDGLISAQAAILSYADITLLTCFAFLSMLPFVSLLKRPPAGVKVAAGH